MTRDRDESEALGMILRHAHAMTLSAGLILRSNGLTPAKYQLLIHLRRRPGMRQHELGRALGVTKGDVSMLATQLADTGLVVRTRQGRANALSLTERGGALADRLQPEERTWTSRQFAALTADELADLVQLLRLVGT